MFWIIYWRNWETPAPQLGNQEVDDVRVRVQLQTLILWMTWLWARKVHRGYIKLHVDNYLSESLIKMREEAAHVCRNSLRQTVYINQIRCLCYNLQGAYKIGVVLTTIYVLLHISSDILLPKIMKIGSRIKIYFKNKKGVVFWNTVYMQMTHNFSLSIFLTSLTFGTFYNTSPPGWLQIS